MRFLRLTVMTLRLAISRFGAGWMFALLTFNFNRITIADLGAIAVIVTSLIGLHHFISFFQIYWGRLADQHPIFGYRRTPYIILSGLGSSLIFLLLPSISVGLGARDLMATIEAFGLIAFFGLMMALNGSSSNALVAEVTDEKNRGAVIAFIWAAIIISGIISAAVSQQLMPVYSHEAMVQLYSLTPIVVLVTTLVGILGIERRISPAEHAAILATQPQERSSPFASFRIAGRMMRSNLQVRGFFFFVILAIMGIFLQDAILEPFGAHVFNMSQAETSRFQQSWGVGALLGMLIIGTISSFFPIAKKNLAILGGLTIATSLAIIAIAGLTHQGMLINPALLLLGLGIGSFNIGALSMMMEMTIEGQTGLFMGIWGMAQGLGNGIANILSGALLTLFVESGLLSATIGYSLIFGAEALIMVVAIGVLRSVNVQEFKGLTRKELGTALAMDTAS